MNIVTWRFHRQIFHKYQYLENNIHPIVSHMLTNVTKVASWRAVEQLIEEVPVSLRHFISDSFTRHGAILVAKMRREIQNG